MGMLSKALPSGWQAPFSLGCLLGLSAAASALALLRLQQRFQQRLSHKPARNAKKKPRKHIRRGDGPAMGDADASAAADPLCSCTREVLNQDAVAWLEGLENGLPEGCCVLTGVPDIHEVDPEGKMGMDGWEQWFQHIVQLVLRRLPKGSLAIFMQTDVKQLSRGGGSVSQGSALGGASGSEEGRYWRWVDKAHLALLAAEKVPGSRLLWHKIIFSGNLSGGGGRNSGVAGYSHYLCFTVGDELEPIDSFPFPDVLRKGLTTWIAGSGAQSLEEVISYLRVRGCKLVVDPFCGEGAVLAVANAYGMGALGVEISKKRAKLAQRQDGTRLLEADHEERASPNGP
mmetsp:Transcript_166913/g.530752  ORF Transcript_166913/g.530752 Transcript_166913/m.530752 type:complete len:343 (-) Transcript_166913:70-1098(-)